MDYARDSSPPPPYPGPNPLFPSTMSNGFCLPPSFETVQAQSEFEDTGCLPAYQGRPIRRYHPYLRRRDPRPQIDESRYHNTIYDEESIMLELPPSITTAPALTAPLTVAVVPAGPTTTTANHVLNSPAVNQDRDVEDEQRRRIVRLRYIIPQFIFAIKRAWERGAQNAPPVTPVPQATPSCLSSSSTTTDSPKH
ncbi:hypothetical protein DXG01_000030 [Tephrocybe rancida]|nr:hypothetical protein DXG01_000030 [Tephrocybe rancida]